MDSAARTWRQDCAWVLVLLVLLPFTAPFSTLDLGMLLGSEQPALVLASHSPSASSSSEVDGRSRGTSGALLDEESFKDVTLTPTASVAPLTVATAVAPSQPAAMSVVRSPLVTLRL
jgi:hypothetical protein